MRWWSAYHLLQLFNERPFVAYSDKYFKQCGHERESRWWNTGHLLLVSQISGINSLRFDSCNTYNNSEGGINIWAEQMTVQGDEKMIFFTDCIWSGNNATMYGAAVHIMAGTLATGSRGHYPTVVFANCSFSSNKVKPTKQVGNNLATQINAVGAFYSSVLTLVFEGRTVFTSNYGTALYLSCSIASFSASSNVSFNNNYGTNGGAIALIGQSYLYLDGSSTFLCQ